MGQDFPDPSREWLARAGAFLTVIAAAWAGAFALAVFSPLWIAKLWIGGGGSRAPLNSGIGVWLASTLATVLAGKSTKTENAGDAKSGIAFVLDLVARYGPAV